MLIKYFYDEKLAHASYVVGCQEYGIAIVIDPGRYIEQYIEFAKQEELEIIAATETHIHADFLSGARELAMLHDVELYLSDEGDQNWKYQYVDEVPCTLVKDGSEFNIGNVTFQVMHTPGHTPESISFLVTDGAKQNAEPIGIFTGDFIFVGDVGRPDLLEVAVGVEHAADVGARQLFRSLQRLDHLPDYIQIWPSHGAGSACGKALGAIPSSTLGYERRTNWAFQYDDEERFVEVLLCGQPEPPTYFAAMKQLNKYGPRLRKRRDIVKLKSTVAYEQALIEVGQVIDTRLAMCFAQGHTEGVINIPHDKLFTNWCGWLAKYDQETMIIFDPDKENIHEIVRDLQSIGLDDVTSYVSCEVIQQLEHLETYEEWTVDELYESIQAGVVPVIDVRSQKEWDEGHLSCATHIMLGRLEKELDKLPKERPLILQCRIGKRSAIAASILQKNGIKEVINLQGGYLALREKGILQKL